MLQGLPESFTQNQTAHILTLAIEQVESLTSLAFLDKVYDSKKAQMQFFTEEIFPHLNRLLLNRKPFAESLSKLLDALNQGKEQNAFWGYLVTASVSKNDILNKDKQAAICLENFVKKLALQTDAEYATAVFMGFMGELIRNRNGLSASIIHNFLYLVKTLELSDARETSDDEKKMIYFLVGNHLAAGLQLREDLVGKNLSPAALVKTLLPSLMTSTMFNVPYNREFYEQKVYPEVQKMSLLTKFKQMKISRGENKKSSSEKKSATTGQVKSQYLISKMPDDLLNANLKPLQGRERSPSVSVKSEEDPSVPLSQFNPVEQGFSYMPLNAVVKLKSLKSSQETQPSVEANDSLKKKKVTT